VWGDRVPEELRMHAYNWSTGSPGWGTLHWAVRGRQRVDLLLGVVHRVVAEVRDPIEPSVGRPCAGGAPDTRP